MSSLRLGEIDRPTSLETDGAIFERHPAIYGLCREHLFRDDTDRICALLWGGGSPAPGATVMEVGCGPGHYARRLAARFAGLRVIGIDCSDAQLGRARTAALARGLTGCRFEQGDARDLPRPEASIDVVIVSRLFTVLPEREQAMSEIHRVLRPGGLAFIAEPRSSLRTGVALGLMSLIARAANVLDPSSGGPMPLEKPRVMDTADFARLTEGQPWALVQRQSDRWYQYAVCEKDS